MEKIVKALIDAIMKIARFTESKTKNSRQKHKNGVKKGRKLENDFGENPIENSPIIFSFPHHKTSIDLVFVAKTITRYQRPHTPNTHNDNGKINEERKINQFVVNPFV